MKRAFLLFFGLLLALAGFSQKIQLKFAEFDPLKGMPEVRRDLGAIHQQPWESSYYLVQFKTIANDLDREFLRSFGAREAGYVPSNSLILELTAKQLEVVGKWNRVRWFGEFLPAYKISPELKTRTFQSSERMAESLMGIRRIAVTLFDGCEPFSALQIASGLGLEILDYGQAGTRWVLSLRGTIGQTENLAKFSEVGFIENEPEIRTRNDVTNWVIQSNVSGLTPIWTQGLTGKNCIVGLIDSRMDMNHQQFKDPSVATPGPTHRKVIAYFSNSGLGASSHGTHVAGTMAGDSRITASSTYRNGSAYDAKIVFRNLSDVNSTNLYSSLVAAHNLGARDHSNSWGDDGTTSYTSHCNQIDQYSWDYEDGMVAFACTNTSTLKTPENAKSVLAVGASTQNPSQNSISFGGTGPTSDGRRKPELFTPGAGIWSAQSGTTAGWSSLSGCSMACPSATGAAAQIRQYFNEYWLLADPTSMTGMISLLLNNDNATNLPTGALIRAMLMNSSVDMTSVAGYPGVREGWGRLLMDNVLWFPGETRTTIAKDVRRTVGLTAGQMRTYYAKVNSSGTPLRITMSFTDFPAVVSAANAAVNDMDLEVVAPDGTIYKGNQIDTATGQSIAGVTVDTKNSTEMVIRTSPLTGVWTVRVKCSLLAQGGKQGFALVINGALQN